MEKRNSVKLTALLVRYIVLCAVMGAVILLLFWQMLTMVMTSGFVLSANTAERQAKAACEAIEEAGSFDVALVPELCEYAFFDETGAVVQTSLSDKELRAAQSYRVTGFNSGGRYYKSAQLQSGVCVLQYTFGTQYRDKALRGKLPDPQLLFVGGFFLTALLVLGGITLRTARRLKRSLQPLSDATNEMAQGNLTWRAASTGIVEYDDVLRAMQKLQTALGESLQAQWSMEHSRVAQMQALAHDLRTPLTVIDGNAQLLEETDLTPEQAESVCAIVRAGGAAQDYMATLRRIASAGQEAGQGAAGGAQAGMEEEAGRSAPASTEQNAHTSAAINEHTDVVFSAKSMGETASVHEKRSEMPQKSAADFAAAGKETVDAAIFLRELRRDARQICRVHGVQLIEPGKAADGSIEFPPDACTNAAEVNDGEAQTNRKACKNSTTRKNLEQSARGSAHDEMPQTFSLCTQEVRRAVGNLVQNAAEHTPQGGAVALTFSCEAPLLKITVEDSGSGFSPQALARATQPLFTEHTGRTPEGNLGLGLAVAQHTAQSHGGSVKLQNTKEGHGCVTFMLDLKMP